MNCSSPDAIRDSHWGKSKGRADRLHRHRHPPFVVKGTAGTATAGTARQIPPIHFTPRPCGPRVPVIAVFSDTLAQRWNISVPHAQVAACFLLGDTVRSTTGFGQ
jgi:hypothetical protein